MSAKMKPRAAAQAGGRPASLQATRATLVAITPDGSLRARTADGTELSCDWLQTSALAAPALEAGNTVLLVVDSSSERGVVLGRIGPYRPTTPEAAINIEASEALTLKCGDASIELRADGKLMVKGEDVLVKARGTQRIKAGTVNIN